MPVDIAYEQAPPYNFLGLPDEYSNRNSSKVLILPVPYEATTSYGSGAKNGPYAIIEASRQVELYDIDLECEAALDWGIHTLPALSPDLSSIEAAVNSIEHAVASLANPDQLVVVLGGEHSISVGAVRGTARVYGNDFVTVQLDAHADLRDSYEGSAYSHACAARRLIEITPVIQLGIRSIDISEAEFMRDNPDKVTTILARDMRSLDKSLHTLREKIQGKNVYLTIDIDALDPSIMPSTGTPEPGGLLWYDMLEIIQTIISAGSVIGIDCVELAPIPGMHAPNFTTAKLLYKVINMVMTARIR